MALDFSRTQSYISVGESVRDGDEDVIDWITEKTMTGFAPRARRTVALRWNAMCASNNNALATDYTSFHDTASRQEESGAEHSSRSQHTYTACDSIVSLVFPVNAAGDQMTRAYSKRVRRKARQLIFT